jgi:hypothetical protein
MINTEAFSTNTSHEKYMGVNGPTMGSFVARVPAGMVLSPKKLLLQYIALVY